MRGPLASLRAQVARLDGAMAGRLAPPPASAPPPSWRRPPLAESMKADYREFLRLIDTFQAPPPAAPAAAPAREATALWGALRHHEGFGSYDE